MRKIFVIILILSFHFGETQNTIDSLQVLLRARSIDEQYVDILNELSFQYILQKPTDALPHINRAISLSDSINYKIGNFRAVTNKGSAYWASGLPDLALKYYLQAKAKVVEDNWVPNASLLNNIGEVFKKKGQYDSAINYYRLGILEAKRAKPIRIPVMLYYNLGEAYLKLNDVDSADKYFRTSFDSARSTNHRRGLSYSYSGFAELAQMENDLERAIFNHQNGIRIRKEIGDKRGVIQSYHQLSSSFFLQGKTKLAKSYLDSALVLSLENKTYDLLSDTYHDIADYYKKKGDFKSA